MAKILITGGAGYIGSHTVLHQEKMGHKIIIYDNLSTGYRESILAGKLVVGDLTNQEQLSSLFQQHSFDCVLHLAGLSIVSESIIQPSAYYQNNVVATLTLLEVMRKFCVKKLVFSSSAAVYDVCQNTLISPTQLQKPLSPYGVTKSIIEQIIRDYMQYYAFQCIVLRYFNVSGAHQAALIGEKHNPETHLIPRALQVASGRLPSIDIYGGRPGTADGTCIRDYIHVEDVAAVNTLAVCKLLLGEASGFYNVGTGHPTSVKEVINMVEKITGRIIKVSPQMFRPEDPYTLVADISSTKKELGWNPTLSELNTIIFHAWNWELQFVQELKKERAFKSGLIT